MDAVKPFAAQPFLVDAQGGAVVVGLAGDGVDDAPLPGTLGLNIGDVVQAQQDGVPPAAADGDAEVVVPLWMGLLILTKDLSNAGRVVGF